MSEGGPPPEAGDAPTVRVPSASSTASTASTTSRGSLASTEGPGAPVGSPPASSGAPDPLPTRRRRAPLATVLGLVILAAVGLAFLASRGVSPTAGDASAPPSATPPSSQPGTSPSSSGTPDGSQAVATPSAAGTHAPGSTVSRGYLATTDELRQRRQLAEAGVEPYASALADLRTWADDAVSKDPKPAKSLRIKGTEGPFVDDTARAYGLALAYAMTGDARYGEASVRDIMAWVDTTTATRKTCPDTGACQTSLIISRTVPGFVFAADLLAGSGLLDGDQEGRLRTWLREIMLPTLSELDNNWGDAGTFARIVLTDYLGDRAGFDAAIAKWRSLMDLVAADGHIPLEVARKRGGIGYTQEALDYKVAAAVIAARRGVDLWDYEGAKGGSLKSALDYLARYMAAPDTWPWHPRVQRRSPSAVWELAYQHWKDPAYVALIEERRPQGWLGHSAVRWTTLTNGIPVS